MYKIIGADQKEYGPVTAEQMRQWIVEGRINGQTPIQAAGDTAWKPLSMFAEFAAVLPSTPPAPPSFAGAPVPGGDEQTVAMSKVTAPAICLMVSGGLTVGLAILGIILGLLGFNDLNSRAFPAQNQTPEMERIVRMARIIGPVLGLAIGGFVILGGIKMKKLESYGVCIAACIVAMLPCTVCCIMGLPVGIWSLVVLNSTDVKNYFSS